MDFVAKLNLKCREAAPQRPQRRRRHVRDRQERRTDTGASTLYLVQADDVRMLQQLHYLHLSEDLFQVLIVQLSLVHYFYRHLEAEKNVSRH